MRAVVLTAIPLQAWKRGGAQGGQTPYKMGKLVDSCNGELLLLYR